MLLNTQFQCLEFISCEGLPYFSLPYLTYVFLAVIFYSSLFWFIVSSCRPSISLLILLIQSVCPTSLLHAPVIVMLSDYMYCPSLFNFLCRVWDILYFCFVPDLGVLCIINIFLCATSSEFFVLFGWVSLFGIRIIICTCNWNWFENFLSKICYNSVLSMLILKIGFNTLNWHFEKKTTTRQVNDNITVDNNSNVKWKSFKYLTPYQQVNISFTRK